VTFGRPEPAPDALGLVGAVLAVALGSRNRTDAPSALVFSALAAAFLWRVATTFINRRRDST
jgi:hypothetical protein